MTDIITIIMGRYFAVINKTRNHRVSSYWIGSPPDLDDMSAMFHYYGWELTDEIWSYSYFEAYIWNQNDWGDGPEENGNQKAVSHDETSVKSKTLPEIKVKFLGSLWSQLKDEKLIVEKTELIRTHLPNWDDSRICKVCKHQFKDEQIRNDQAHFYHFYHFH